MDAKAVLRIRPRSGATAVRTAGRLAQPRAVLLQIALSACLITAGSAWAQSNTRVTRPEQQLRDEERVRILQTELAREQQNAFAAEQRVAASLRTHDAAGLAAATAARQRADESIAALQREITSTHRAGQTPAGSIAEHRAAVPTRTNTGPWWDVYARSTASLAPQSESPTRTPMPVVRPQ